MTAGRSGLIQGATLGIFFGMAKKRATYINFDEYVNLLSKRDSGTPNPTTDKRVKIEPPNDH